MTANVLTNSSLSPSRSKQSVRQLLGVVVGIVCLLAAMRVTAAESGGTGTGGSDSDQIKDMLEQGKGLHVRVERMATEGEAANKAATDSKELSATQCAQNAMPVLRGTKRLADGHYETMVTAPPGDKATVSGALEKLVVVHDRMGETLGTLKACTSNSSGSPDGNVLIDRQTTGTPNVQTGDNLSDLSSQAADTPSASPFFDTKKK